VLKRIQSDAAREMTNTTLQVSVLKAEKTKHENRVTAAYDDLYDPPKNA